MKALPISALLEAVAENLSAADIVASKEMAHIANQIVTWRLEHNLTQSEFAKQLGVTQGTIAKWENGDFNFTIKKLAEISCKIDAQLHISFDKPVSKTLSTNPSDNGYVSNSVSDNILPFPYKSKSISSSSELYEG